MRNLAVFLVALTAAASAYSGEQTDRELSRFVHYERGGIAHTFHVLVAKLTKDNAKPKIVWRAVGAPFKDYPAFLNALRTGKLDDRLDYAR